MEIILLTRVEVILPDSTSVPSKCLYFRQDEPDKEIS